MRRMGMKGLALLVCLCVLASVLAVSALAVDVTQPMTLTVSATDSEDEEFAKDVAAANVVIDLYQVAAVTKQDGSDGIDIVLMEPYDVLTMPEELNNESWHALAQDALAMVAASLETEEPYKPVKSIEAESGKLGPTDLTAGVYLLVARGSEIKDYVKDAPAGEGEEAGSGLVTIAQSAAYEYAFSPELIVLPTKADENGDDVISTAAEDGEWIYNQTVTLKPSRTERFGELTITKRLLPAPEGAEIVPYDFVFYVTAELNGEAAELKLPAEEGEPTRFIGPAVIHFDEAGTESIRLLAPVGAKVTVREDTDVIQGIYQLESDGTVEIEEMTMAGAEARFTNSRLQRQGHSIVNSFEYQNDETGWQWVTPVTG